MSVADHYQVIVHVDASALGAAQPSTAAAPGAATHSAEGSGLRGGLGRSDLLIETVRRLCCDGSLVTVTEDAEGNPLQIGRKQRTVPTALRRALWSRDRGCTFPGCHRRHRYVDAHHIEHWAHGGEMSLDNLALQCTYHHRLLHEGAFSMRRTAEGGLEFRRPDGRVIPKSGYRLGDIVDDDTGDDGATLAARFAEVVRRAKVSAPSAARSDRPSGNASAEGRPAKMCETESRATEVREPVGVYRAA